MLDHFFPLLFPKDFKSLKIFDIQLREVGAKRPLTGTSKVNRQTDKHTNKQTDTQMDILTYRKHRPSKTTTKNTATYLINAQDQKGLSKEALHFTDCFCLTTC